MTIQPAGCRTTQHCAVHDFCHRCMPSLDEATQHLVKAIDAAGITTGTGRVYAALAATIRDAARTAAAFETTMDSRTAPKAASNGAARQTTGQTDTHPGYDIAGYPETHAGPREKCPDPACETDQHANCGAECPAVGQPAEAQPADRARVRWGVDSNYPNGGTCSLPAVDDRTSAEKYLKAARESSPDATHRLVRETTTWTVEDER